MPADQRTYITVHDGMPEHPKIESLSDEAFRLLVTMWCWCSRYLTDGVVRAAVWEKRGTPETRLELVTAGLVEPTQDGVQMHDYLEHQRSAAEVAELKEKRAAAGRKGGLARAQASAKASAAAPAKQTPKQKGGKPVADTETDTEEEKTSSSEVASDPDDNPSDEVKALCDYLAERVRENGHKATVGKVWYRSCRLLLTRDEHTAEQVRKAIDWATADPFWSANIRSMQTLREKYTTLRAQAQQRPLKAVEDAKPKRYVPPYTGDPDDLEAYQEHYRRYGQAS